MLLFFVHLSQCSQTHAHAYTITSPTQCTITLILMLTPCHRYIKCCYFFSPWSVLTDSRSRLHNYITNTVSASESAALMISFTFMPRYQQIKCRYFFLTSVSDHRLTLTLTRCTCHLTYFFYQATTCNRVLQAVS